MPRILNAIAHRARAQSKAFATFLSLKKAGIISLRGLRNPVQFSGTDTENRSGAIRSLKCFEWFWSTNREDHLSIPGGYDLAVVWLATMLIRGRLVADLPRIMVIISQLQTLGDPDTDFLTTQFPRGSCQLRAGAAYGGKICFWLPHNLGEKVDLRRVYEGFDREYRRFDSLFSRFFGYSMTENPPHRKHGARGAGHGLVTRIA